GHSVGGDSKAHRSQCRSARGTGRTWAGCGYESVHRAENVQTRHGGESQPVPARAARRYIACRAQEWRVGHNCHLQRGLPFVEQGVRVRCSGHGAGAIRCGRARREDRVRYRAYAVRMDDCGRHRARLALADSDGDAERTLREEFPAAELQRDGGMAELVEAALASVREGHDLSESLGSKAALDLRGTVFQLRVWQALRQIPRGETRSYSQLAAELGDRNATRAVARACATNRVAILVPCHR